MSTCREHFTRWTLLLWAIRHTTGVVKPETINATDVDKSRLTAGVTVLAFVNALCRKRIDV